MRVAGQQLLRCFWRRATLPDHMGKQSCAAANKPVALQTTLALSTDRHSTRLGCAHNQEAGVKQLGMYMV